MGLCPLHHVVGVVHVPLAPALRYSPLGDPEPPEDTAKAARARLLGLCGFLPLAPAAFPGVLSSLCAGLRLPASPRAPCLVWFCLPASLPFVLVGFCGFPPSCWLGLFFGLVCLVLLGVVRFCLFSRSSVLL